MAKVEKKPVSKKEAVLKYLQTHKSGITKAAAEEKFGVQSLSSVISQIKKSGIDVVCEKVTVKKTGETYSVYKLK